MKLVQASNDPEGILRRETKALDPKDKSLVTEISAKLRAGITLNQNLVGLAANQIGIDAKACIVMIGHEQGEELQWLTMINPEVTWACTEEVEMVEGCGSLRVPEELYFIVSRPREITVSFYDKYGQHMFVQLHEYSARVALHEIDHLNGILISDKGVRYDPEP